MLYPSEKHGKEEQWGIICDGNLCHVYGRNLTFVLQNSSNRYQSERLCVLQIDLNSYIVFFAKKNLMLNIFSCLFCRIVQLNLHIYFFHPACQLLHGPFLIWFYNHHSNATNNLLHLDQRVGWINMRFLLPVICAVFVGRICASL